jgi:DNA-binding transcriptional ArsR family regulator
MSTRRSRLRPYHIGQFRQLRAIVSPIRQEIVDAVAASGPCTISELADSLGRRQTALYAHVSALKAVGLLQRVGVRSNGGRPSAVLMVPGRPMYLDYDIADPKRRKLIARYAVGMLRNAGRDFVAATAHPRVKTAGKARSLWAARSKGWLSPKELAEVNVLLNRLISILRDGQRTKGTSRKLHELTFVVCPFESDIL